MRPTYLLLRIILLLLRFWRLQKGVLRRGEQLNYNKQVKSYLKISNRFSNKSKYLDHIIHFILCFNKTNKSPIINSAIPTNIMLKGSDTDITKQPIRPSVGTSLP